MNGASSSTTTPCTARDQHTHTHRGVTHPCRKGKALRHHRWMPRKQEKPNVVGGMIVPRCTLTTRPMMMLMMDRNGIFLGSPDQDEVTHTGGSFASRGLSCSSCCW
jgi:hypothetical protein